MPCLGKQALFSLLVLGFAAISAQARAVERRGALRASNSSVAAAAAFRHEVRAATEEALGCGESISPQYLKDIEAVLLPMYSTLPKNSYGRLERRSLRYLAYRYFHQKAALVVRGFEPVRPVNESHWGAAEILSEQLPAYVESVLESAHAQEHGFDLHDATQMVATLDRLIFDSESALLERVYALQHKPSQRLLSEAGLKQLLEAYMALWMAGEDIVPYLNRPQDLEQVFPHWQQIVSFAHGQMRALNFERMHKPKVSTNGNNGLSSKYSFEDAHKVVGGITRSFASFWESECQMMKQKLVSADKHRTGRVLLSKFYGKTLNDAEWRFAESESYLRDLGALDETSWLGKQVIIPNYIQGASNCIVSTSHYNICCINECEPIMQEIESAIGQPMADPSNLLAIVGNMTAMTSLEDEFPVKLSSSLVKQLESIAAANRGQVPIHGRLFAQWLHYVFPHDCAFPHKSGTASQLSPNQYGDGYLAQEDEMAAHTKEEVQEASLDKDELHWMSQWSEEEELIASYEGLLSKNTSGNTFIRLACLLLFVAAVVFGVVGVGKKGTEKECLLPSFNGKAHYV